jgi:hypothetical protein
MLVIIRYLYLMRAVILPDEADAELIVDSDAVLAYAITLQRLKSITRRDAQITEIDRRFYLIELANGNRRNPCPAPIRSLFVKLLCIGVFKALNHLKLEYNAPRYM